MVESGKMVETNTWFRDGRWYRKADGTTASGWLQINGDWYAFNARGRMITGFTHTQDDTHDYESNVYYEDCGRYYYGSDGRRMLLYRLADCLMETGTILTIILRQSVVGK